MRLTTIIDGGLPRPVVVRGDLVLPIAQPINELAARGLGGLPRVDAWADAQPASSWRSLERVRLGPAAEPRAIYTVGLNYDGPGAASRPERPLIYAKAAGSVAGHGATLAWDRSVSDDVDAEIELGVVIGPGSSVFGYTCVNDISARDEQLDGDQWLLGKSLPGFCPVGPWMVTADEFDPGDVRLVCTINGEPIQDDRTTRMRFGIPEIITFLGRHLELRPGDLIATGTPVRLTTPPGPSRRLRPGDSVTVSIEGIGELTTTVA